MKLNKETLKRIIKEELGNILNENEDMATIYETISEIEAWAEDNGYWSFTSGVDPWFAMMKELNPQGLQDLAKKANKESVDAFEAAVRELGEDY